MNSPFPIPDDDIGRAIASVAQNLGSIISQNDTDRQRKAQLALENARQATLDKQNAEGASLQHRLVKSELRAKYGDVPQEEGQYGPRLATPTSPMANIAPPAGTSPPFDLNAMATKLGGAMSGPSAPSPAEPIAAKIGRMMTPSGSFSDRFTPPSAPSQPAMAPEPTSIGGGWVHQPGASEDDQLTKSLRTQGVPESAIPLVLKDPGSLHLFLPKTPYNAATDPDFMRDVAKATSGLAETPAQKRAHDAAARGTEPMTPAEKAHLALETGSKNRTQAMQSARGDALELIGQGMNASQVVPHLIALHKLNAGDAKLVAEEAANDIMKSGYATQNEGLKNQNQNTLTGQLNRNAGRLLGSPAPAPANLGFGAPAPALNADEVIARQKARNALP